MKKRNRLRMLRAGLAVALSLPLAALAACETEDPSKAVVENGYPAGQTVYRTWWVATYFPDPVPSGMTSSEQRSVPASDFAYAVLAPGWDPSATTPPARFVVVKSKAPLSVARGDTLHIRVDDQTFTGSCAANQPLSQDDADFITQRIFPGEFAGATYDARTCTSTSTATAANDAGTDGG